MSFLPPQEQLAILKDSVPPIEIVEEGELLAKIERSFKENRPLRIKQGFDASAPDLHIGHAVSIWKLRTFQDLGHTVIFLIGDFTAMIGDPSGKSKTRPRLTREQAIVNSETYKQQVFKMLDPAKTEVRFNSEWHGSRNIYEFLDLASRRTVARILERDDFAKRYRAGEDISLLEFLYPLVQAYDSVELKADVELGGTDQKFNLVLARHIQRSYGQEPQVLFLMPLLKGLDGNDKMSKSLDNYIGVTDEAEDMYGKVMSISDELLEEYYVLASGLSNRALRETPFMEIVQNVPNAKLPGMMNEIYDLLPTHTIVDAIHNGAAYWMKHILASLVVSRYHPSPKVFEASWNFNLRFGQRAWPTVEELRSSGNSIEAKEDVEWLPRLIVLAGHAKSNNEAMRLIRANAVEVDGEKFDPSGSLELDVSKPRVVKVGKRRFFVVEKA